MKNMQKNNFFRSIAAQNLPQLPCFIYTPFETRG